MTLSDLLTTIHNSTATEISIKRLTAKHGNDNQQGDYQIIKLKIGDDEHQFQNKDGGWKKD